MLTTDTTYPRPPTGFALLAVLALLTVAACSDADGARDALTDAGYSDIRTTGHSWTGCGEEDTYSTGFVARSPGGSVVSGVVCAGMGWGKATTIRTFGRVRS